VPVSLAHVFPVKSDYEVAVFCCRTDAPRSLSSLEEWRKLFNSYECNNDCSTKWPKTMRLCYIDDKGTGLLMKGLNLKYTLRNNAIIAASGCYDKDPVWSDSVKEKERFKIVDISQQC